MVLASLFVKYKISSEFESNVKEIFLQIKVLQGHIIMPNLFSKSNGYQLSSKLLQAISVRFLPLRV